MLKNYFGSMPDGKTVSSYSVGNGIMSLTVLDYGGIIQSLKFNGTDVVLGYNTLSEYASHDGYLGAIVGRYANRIAGGSFKLNKKTYKLYKNDGKNSLHGGQRGLSRVIWNVEGDDTSITLKYVSPDNEEGYPGNLIVGVKYSLLQNGLAIEYSALSDKDTVINLTNHTYFNFIGGETIENHFVYIDADYYTPVDTKLIPTGEKRLVAGTAFDFRCAKSIGRDIGADDEQLKIAGGYDHNFVLRGTGFRKFAELSSAKAGITMTGFTDSPGVQFYTGNFLSPRIGKNGNKIIRRGGVCFETQSFPDSVHHPEFPSTELKAGELYHTVTEFRFSKF
ncbi:MAG TPA: galactose-1-epimerase [Clostridiales bacterium]|nr:galactose-1-epimerase [Clostridiales bacterium]